MTVTAGPLNASYLEDASGFKGWADEAFAPSSEQELAEILRQSARDNVPVTIAGAGSGLTGGRVPQGGRVLSLEKFQRLDIHAGYAQAGAAVTLLELRDAAAPSRQFYAPDPTEITASVGGVIATNASGSRSFRYGSARRHIRSLRVALANGSIREFRRGEAIDFDVPAIPLPQVTKCTAGYSLSPGMDWVDLFCGSEGTLGVIVEAELALCPVPTELFSAVVFFSSDADALDAVDSWRSIPELRMLEYVGRAALDLISERYPQLPAGAQAALLIEAEGEVDYDTWEQRLSAARASIEHSWFAVNGNDRERFRKLRHALPEMVNATVLQRGFMKMGTDYAVPLHRNREMLRFYAERLETELPGQYVIYGHIGDAHVHVNMLPATGAQAEIAARLLKEFAVHAVSLGGTVSAEHGLGKRKAHLLALQYAPEHIEAMMAVKRRLDPQWLLGRGTLFPAG